MVTTNTLSEVPFLPFEYAGGRTPQANPAVLNKKETINLNSSGNTITSTLTITEKLDSLFFQVAINFSITSGSCTNWVPTCRILKNGIEVDKLVWSIDLPTIATATNQKLLYAFGTQKQETYYENDLIEIKVDISVGAAASACDFNFNTSLFGKYS